MHALSTDKITTDATEVVGHAINAVNAVRSTVADLDLSNISDAASDLTETAHDVSVASGRFIVRTARAGGRVARRNPMPSIGLAVVLLTIVAIVFKRSRDAQTSTSHLEMVA